MNSYRQTHTCIYKKKKHIFKSSNQTVGFFFFLSPGTPFSLYLLCSSIFFQVKGTVLNGITQELWCSWVCIKAYWQLAFISEFMIKLKKRKPFSEVYWHPKCRVKGKGRNLFYSCAAFWHEQVENEEELKPVHVHCAFSCYKFTSSQYEKGARTKYLYLTYSFVISTMVYKLQ